MVNDLFEEPVPVSVILVLGNGFDISCGLKTTYKDFFRNFVIPKVLQNNSSNVSLYDSEKETLNKDSGLGSHDLSKAKEVSLWEYYLANKLPKENQYSTKAWFDIENLIADSFKKEECWDLIKTKMFKEYPVYSTIDLREDPIIGILHDALHERYKDEIYDDEGCLIDREYYNALLKELNILEAHLGEYIREMVVDNHEYVAAKDSKIDILRNKINKILGDKYNATVYTEEFKIVSLNYTKTPNDKIYYIHGTYDNPIIGVENLDADDDNLIIFSKVKRCADHENNPYSQVGEGKNYEIAFYGTSFGESDYMDYKSLQDNYLADNGSLIVLYSNFDNKDRLSSTNEAVARLIKSTFKLANLEEAYNLIRDSNLIKIERI